MTANASSKQWPIKRLRYLTSRGPSDSSRALLAHVSEASFLPMEAIGEQGQLDLSRIHSIENLKTGYSQFFDGDVVIAKITPCFENGKGALIQGTLDGVGFGTTELYVLTPEPELDGRFLYYVTVDPRFRKLGESYMTGAAGQQRVPEDFVRDFQVPIPDLSQQRIITDYLDHETTRLDALVAEKERLLDLLAEKHQALITRAITRGLDPNVPLRDSGISWLGEIPAHWETWKVGHLSEVGNGSTPSRNNAAYWSEGRIPWLNSSVVNRPEVTHADQFVTALAAKECHLPQVKSGSVLVAITGQGKTRGRAAVLAFDATINQHLAFIHPKQSRLLPWFLKWTLFAAYDFLRSISDDAGGTKGALTCEEVANLRVPVPPVREQAVILAKIAASVEQLDSLQAVAKNTISLTKERRAALISAAVTGQIDLEKVA